MNRRTELFSLRRPGEIPNHDGTADWQMGAKMLPPAGALDDCFIEDEYYYSSRLKEAAADTSRSGRRKMGRASRSSAKSSSGFRCEACGSQIASVAWLSGVRNRNHCPYCLWSKHLDLITAGDRLAACKQKMHPVGLTLKIRRKKCLPGPDDGTGIVTSALTHASPSAGELMVVHLCEGCSRVSINRIAADDDAETLMKVFWDSSSLERELMERLLSSGVRMLRQIDSAQVKRRLFGAGG